jgi:hypothetical protein
MWENNRSIKSHYFRGTVIFNTNYFPLNPFTNALRDRCIFNDIRLSSQQIKDKINSRSSYQPNKKIWEVIKERIIQKSELSEQELKTLLDRINCPRSVRDIWKLEIIGKFSKTLIGNLDLIDYFIDRDKLWEVVNSNSKRSEKVKQIAKIKNISERQARKYVPKLF